jgi:alpha-tubulin suppressor-like RCC1 family protein
MSLTKITDGVIALSTISFDKLTQGGPRWSSSGGISATGFVGDGSGLTGVGTVIDAGAIQNIINSNTVTGYITADGFVGDGSGLTNLFPAASVVEVSDIAFTILPEHDNATLVFANSATVDINPLSDYTRGHKTALIQNGNDPLIFSGLLQNVDGYNSSKGLYSKAFVQFIDPFDGWTLYGDLTASAGGGGGPIGPSLSGVSFTQIAAFNARTFALSGSQIFATGWNDQGQLGIGSTVGRSIFTKISIPNNAAWSSIAGGGTNSTFVLSGTDLYVTGGNNFYGCLGVGDNSNRSTFTKVSGSWIAADGGNDYSIALSSDNSLFACGNYFGGNVFAKLNSPMVPNGAKWSNIAAGTVHALALSSNGDLYVWGQNFSGQIGLNNTVNSNTFTKVLTPANAKWSAIYAGYDYSLALSSTDLYVTGSSQSFGRLGLGDTVNRSTFTKVSGSWIGVWPGYEHTLALSANGDMYSTGRNQYGQLGLGNTIDRSTFTKISGNWTNLAKGSDGSHSIVLSGFKLFVAGAGNDGELGLGVRTNRSTFTQVTAVAI